MSVNSETILQVKTPAYIFDLDALRERVRMMRARLGEKIRLVYAVKANPFLVRALIPLVDAFEICSPGEEVICRRAGVPGEMMVLSGVNKERENFSQIMDRYGQAPVYTAESERQLAMLDGLAREKGLKLRVLLRLCGGSQFGMDEQVLRCAAAHRERYPGLVFTGVHFFTGTQKKPKVIAREIARVDALLCSLASAAEGDAAGKGSPAAEGADRDLLWRELEYGPGLAVRYFTGDAPCDDETVLADLRARLEEMRFDGRVTLEMGRFFAAYCGCYVTRVEDVKTNEGTRYCIIDGGIHQVNYYGSNMGMKIPYVRQLRADSFPEGTPLPWTVCGSLCTTADVITRELPLTDLKIHDILVFERTGAYAVTEGVSLFLSRDLPRVYLAGGDGLDLVRDRVLTEVLNDGTTD